VSNIVPLRILKLTLDPRSLSFRFMAFSLDASAVTHGNTKCWRGGC
jgi:hypothetical protein